MLNVRGVSYLVDGAEPGEVDRDLTVIAGELHCNAVMLKRLAATAVGAEALRVEHPHRVVLLVGSEFSHTVSGIVPGPRSFIRLRIVVL